MSSNRLTRSIRAPYLNDTGADGVHNDFTMRYANGMSVVDPPMVIPFIFRAIPNAAIATTRFHVTNVYGKVVGISEIHNVAGNHASAVTGHITKEVSGQAPGAGVSLMSGTFNLKGTANVLQSATLSSAHDTSGKSVLEFAPGNMFSFVLTGNAQTAAVLEVIVWVQPYTHVQEFSFYSNAVTAQDQVFFIANRPYPIQAIRYVHKTAETTDTTANMQVTLDASTNAPGAGSNLLTNDSNAGFDGNATANVPQVGAFPATTMVANDRLAVDFADASYTQLAGVCVTVTVTTTQKNRLEIPVWLYDTDATDFWLFISNRDYEMWDGRFLHAVAAGGVSTLNIEKASGTTDASSGTSTLNTAVNLNATANTIQVADFVATKATTLLVADDRLSTEFVNAEQSMVGFAATLSLKAV